MPHSYLSIKFHSGGVSNESQDPTAPSDCSQQQWEDSNGIFGIHISTGVNQELCSLLLIAARMNRGGGRGGGGVGGSHVVTKDIATCLAQPINTQIVAVWM